MAIESALRHSVAVRLNAGTRPGTGNMLVRTTSLSGLVHGADAARIMSVVGALAPVLSHPLFRIERTAVTVLEN